MKNKVRFFPLILNIANQIAEPSFIHVVLVTLHSFTTPEELMDLLMIRYAIFNGFIFEPHSPIPSFSLPSSRAILIPRQRISNL